MKKINKLIASSVGLASIVTPIALSSCSNNLQEALNQMPTVRKYDNLNVSRKYTIDNSTRFIISTTIKGSFLELLKNISCEWYAKLPNQLVQNIPFEFKEENTANGIFFTQLILDTDHFDNYPDLNAVDNPEAYQITIGNNIEIKFFTYSGLLWATRTLLQMQILNGGIFHGVITDWPKVNQRGIYFDFSGRAYGIDFLREIIQEMSWDKLNTLGLRFASGGVHVDAHKLPTQEEWDASTNAIEPLPTTGTWFKTQFTGDEKPTWYNTNSGIIDGTKQWDWPKPDQSGSYIYDFSEFGEAMNLAKLNGINIVPEANIFAHAWFVTEQTNNSAKVTIDGEKQSYLAKWDGRIKATATKQEIEDNSFAYLNDFAIWDEQRSITPVTINGAQYIYPYGHRRPDTMELRNEVDSFTLPNGALVNSKTAGVQAKQFASDFVNYFVDRFQLQMNKYNGPTFTNFSVGGDEYIESLYWSNLEFEQSSQEAIISSIYDWTAELSQTLKAKGITLNQWNDELYRNIRNQDGTLIDSIGWPNASTDDYSKLTTNVKNNMTINYWWKGVGDLNMLASVDDYLNNGINSIVNYNYYYLYFCDDSNEYRMPTAESIFNEWHPGIFPKNHEDGANNQYQVYTEDENGNYPSWLKGAMTSVWWDWTTYVLPYVYSPLKTFSQKCWNGSDATVSFSDYAKIMEKLGHAPLLNIDV